METDIKTLVIRGSGELEKSKVFSVDRSKYMNASEALSCIRQQWYKKHEPESAAEEERGFADRGNHDEQYLVAALLAANVPLVNAGEHQSSAADDHFRISATPDGFLSYNEKKPIGIEFKTIDPRTNRKYLPKEKHITQLQLSMALQEKPLGVKFDHGLLVYMDASNFHDIIQFEVPRDDGILKRLEPRAKKVLDTRKVTMLDREGKKNGDCKNCAFTEVCGVTVAEANASAKLGRKRGNKGSALDILVTSYIEHKDAEEAAKEKRAAAAEDIKKELRSRKVTDMIIAGVTVMLQAVSGRVTLDKAAVEKAGIDLSPYEKTGAPSERLVIK